MAPFPVVLQEMARLRGLRAVRHEPIVGRYHAGYYAAYLIDPAGNNVEAVFHDRTV